MSENLFLKIGERSLMYHQTGNGETLVIAIPGGPGLTHHYLKSIHEALPDDQYTVLSYSPSGTIGNQHDPFYKSIFGYTQELKSIIDQLGFSQVVLIGHSFSGVIVHDFITRYPEVKVKAEVMINTFYSGKMIKRIIEQRVRALPSEFHRKRDVLLANGDRDTYDELIFQYWFPSHVIRTKELPPELLQSLAGFRNTAMQYYYLGFDSLSISGAILSWDCSSSLNAVTCPFLMMSGEFDYMSRQDFDEYCSRLTNVQAWFHPETSHFPMLEKPIDFQMAIIEFLNKVLNIRE